MPWGSPESRFQTSSTHSSIFFKPFAFPRRVCALQPDAQTVVVILDLTSPNILNFKPGNGVLSKLPRQFFIELQSR